LIAPRKRIKIMRQIPAKQI